LIFAKKHRYGEHNKNFPKDSVEYRVMSMRSLLVIVPALLSIARMDAQEATGSSETFGKCATTATKRIGCITNAQYESGQLMPDARLAGYQGPLIIKSSPRTKQFIPFATKTVSQRGQLSPTLKAHAEVNHPEGGALFPNHSDLAGKLNAMISTIKKTGAFVNNPQMKPPYPTTSGNTTPTELSHFVPLWRKVQYLILNDLYIYLTGIYTSFNLTQCWRPAPQTTGSGTTSTPSASDESPRVCDEITFLETEQKTALSKKSLIVSHLLNVIQDQMNFICSHHTPLMPKSFALKAGSSMLKHDYTSDPLFLLRNPAKAGFSGNTTTPAQRAALQEVVAEQQSYLKTIATILDFFNTYTNYLTKPDPKSSIPGTTAFVSIAQHVANTIQNNPYNKAIQEINNTNTGSAVFTNKNIAAAVTKASANQNMGALKGIAGNPQLQVSMEKVKKLRALKKSIKPINPPFFSYNNETIRALKVIPMTANKFPKNVQSIPLPENLVDAAKKKTPAKDFWGNTLGYPVAYMEDNKLFINIPQASATRNTIKGDDVILGGPYAQEIRPQPAWLNSYEGVIKMLRACLGDYTQLIGMDVLDGCTEAIICKALNKPCTAAVQQACTKQLQLVDNVQKQYHTHTQTAQQTG